MTPGHAPAPATPIAGPPLLASVPAHPGFARVFQPGRRTFGEAIDEPADHLLPVFDG